MSIDVLLGVLLAALTLAPAASAGVVAMSTVSIAGMVEEVEEERDDLPSKSERRDCFSKSNSGDSGWERRER